MDKRQMVEAFRQVYGGLGLPPEMETSLLGAWCMAWTAGAKEAWEDADSLACTGSILSDEIAESQDLFLQEWASLVDQKGYWTESGTEWKSLPEYTDLAAKSRDGLPCIVRLTRSGYLRSVSYPDGTTIPANEPCPPEKTCYRWFVPDYGQLKDCQQPGESRPQDVSEWIPVSERLPETHKFVLVKNGVGVPHVASWTGKDWRLPSPNGQLSHWNQDLVTHWKPL